MNELKRLRTAYKINQTQLANDLGVSRITISNLEREIHSPNLGLASKLADYFCVGIRDIFPQKKKPKEKLINFDTYVLPERFKL